MKPLPNPITQRLKARILIISDEPESAKVWGFSLNQVGLEVRLVGIDEQVLDIWEKELPDLIILEDFNNEIEELELCHQLRESSLVPILYLTNKIGEAFYLEAYKAGADECIPYPITPRLFQAKVKAWLRWTKSVPLAVLNEVRVGGFVLNADQKRLILPDGEVTKLTLLEARLLFLMMNHPGACFESKDIIEKVWGYSSDNGENKLLKSLIYRLRRKIEPNPNEPCYLVTEENTGYKFQIIEN